MSGLTFVSQDTDLEARLTKLIGRDHTVRSIWGGDWRTSAEAAAIICAATPLIVTIGADVRTDDAIELLQAIDIHRPEIGLVAFRSRLTEQDTLLLLRHGAREVLDANLASDDELSTALDRVFHLVTQRLSSVEEAPELARRVIAVVSPKGGTGKTTIATNLAVGLARAMPNQVLLIDLDMQIGDVASAIGVTPENSLKDALGNGQVDLTAMKVFLTRHDSGLAVLTPPDSLADAEDIDADVLKKTMATLSEEFPIVILDTAAGIDEYAFVALEFASDLLFVTTTDVPAIRAVAKQLEALDRLHLTEPRRKLVLNRSDAKVGLSQTDIEQTIGMPASFTVPSSRVIPLSTNQGVPHIESGATDATAKALRQLVAEFTPERARDKSSRRFARKGRS
ncbi:MAG: pilus assembly protein CpaE [Acidimicrobiales bacterium]|jgi:pilus assembly protein CpaE